MRLVGITSMAAVCVLVVACGGGGGKVAAPARPAVAVDLEELLAKWKQNPVAVATEYQGTQVEVVGFVGQMGQSPGRDVYVYLSPISGGGMFDSALVFVDGQVLADMKNHPTGSRARFRVLLNQGVDRVLRVEAISVSPP